MKKLLLTAIACLFTIGVIAQNAITIDPPYASAWDEITLYLDVSLSCPDSALLDTDTIAMHSGVTIDGVAWQNVVPFDGTGINGQLPYLTKVQGPPSSLTLPINFESSLINYDFTDFGGNVSTVVNNPDASGINTSNRVAQSVKGEGAETWAGSYLTLETPIDFTINKTFKMKVWSPKVGDTVLLKVENLDYGDIFHEAKTVTTVANEWEELEFNFSDVNTENEYQKVIVFLDFGVPGDGSTYYYDDIELTSSTPGESIVGTWKIAPEAGSIGVGPYQGDMSWWSINEAGVAERACYYDDEYIFGADGSFMNVLGDDTWVEQWQGQDPPGCFAPVYPHDGSNPATYNYDETAGTLTLNAVGAYLGIPKAVNGMEIFSPDEAPESITYLVSFSENNTRMTVDIHIAPEGEMGWWRFILVKEEPPVPNTPWDGTWLIAPEAGAIGVGPGQGDISWWSNTEEDLTIRVCYFDDEYVFGADGSFMNVLGAETWVEEWQGNDPMGCAAPVYPHDGSIPATFTWDETEGTLTLNGMGSYLGIPKAYNGGELISPEDAPNSITYIVEFQENNTVAIVDINIGVGWWRYKMIKQQAREKTEKLEGTWKMLAEAGSFGVGPQQGDMSWWSIDEAGVEERECFYNDEYVFGANGSFMNVMGDETWVEEWQGVGTDGCGAPIAPHDGSNAATWEWDGDAGELTLNGVGAFLGLAKAANGFELTSPGEAPESITYLVEFSENDTIMTIDIETIDDVWWRFIMVKQEPEIPEGIIWKITFTPAEYFGIEEGANVEAIDCVFNGGDWSLGEAQDFDPETGDCIDFKIPLELVPKARVQVIHNSADTAYQYVDVWLNNELLLDNFAFHTASPFVYAPAGEQFTISIKDTASTNPDNPVWAQYYTLEDGKTYILVADGIISPSGYDPNRAFDIAVYDMGRETGLFADSTDVLIHHGSTDAPIIDIFKMEGGELVDNLNYFDFEGYLELPTADYTLEVRNETGEAVVASFSAPLETLELNGAAITVVASGFLNPENNSNGEPFGLWAATAVGGNLIELSPVSPSITSRVQVIHNSADSTARYVDVWLDDVLLLDNFAFRKATPFIDAPAGEQFTISIKDSASTNPDNPLWAQYFTLQEDEIYILVADGIISPSGYDPNRAFDIAVYDMAREAASEAENTDLLIHHGATDAPMVDIYNFDSVSALITDSLAYSHFAGYLELSPDDYSLQIRATGSPDEVATFEAPLSAFEGEALTAVASGFLNPDNNSNGPAFGLWVARAIGGDLIQLQEITSIEENDNASTFRLFPNPANTVLNIENMGNADKVQIFSIVGSLIKTVEVGSANATINVSDLNKGIYFVSVYNAEGVQTSKFIKE